MTARKKEPERRFRGSIIEDIRPWGKFRSYPRSNVCSIKVITVNPKGAVSLQYHRNRHEYWIVLDRGLEVTLGERIWRPRKNEEIFVPQRTPHRLRCVGRQPGRVMEIWIGKSSESDIVRIQDFYGRT